jgi:hypothetical protein
MCIMDFIDKPMILTESCHGITLKFLEHSNSGLCLSGFCSPASNAASG